MLINIGLLFYSSSVYVQSLHTVSMGTSSTRRGSEDCRLNKRDLMITITYNGTRYIDQDYF